MHHLLRGGARVVVALFCAAFWSGCSSGPSAIRPVEVDARSASTGAIELYDTDGDGALNDAELAAVPGILKYKDKYDSNDDGLVSAREIQHRIEQWESQAMGLRTLNVVVLVDERPLANAEVRFIPEPYLGDGPKPAMGTTNSQGVAKISVDPADMSDELRALRIRGISGGTYKIEIQLPQRPLDARYNSETTIGEEIARDTLGDRLILRLDSN